MDELIRKIVKDVEENMLPSILARVEKESGPYIQLQLKPFVQRRTSITDEVIFAELRRRGYSVYTKTGYYSNWEDRPILLYRE